MSEDFHRCMDAQAALEAAEIVVGNILPDHPAQLLPAGEFPAIVPLPLEDAPEALHRPVVNTFAHPGHTLRHPGCGQLVLEHPGRILKAPVAVEQRVRIRIGSQSLTLFQIKLKAANAMLYTFPVTDRSWHYIGTLRRQEESYEQEQ